MNYINGHVGLNLKKLELIHLLGSKVFLFLTHPQISSKNGWKRFFNPLGAKYINSNFFLYLSLHVHVEILLTCLGYCRK